MKNNNNPSKVPFLVVFAGTVLVGCLLTLMVPVLFGAIGETAPWQGWLAGALGVVLIAFGWGAQRLRPHARTPQNRRGRNRFL